MRRWLAIVVGALLILLFGWRPKRPAPGSVVVTFISEGGAMGSLRIAVAHPVVRDDGSPFDPLTELRGWRAYTRVVGAQNWTEVGTALNLPNVTERVVGNVPAGAEYEAQVTWEDIYGQVSDPANDSTDVPVPAKPAPGGVSLTYVP